MPLPVRAARIYTEDGWQDIALAGPPGPLGPPGPPGSGGDLSYIHTQTITATTWNVAHNLGKWPSVSVIDTGNSVVIPDVHYVDANNLQLSFGSATSGKAYLN